MAGGYAIELAVGRPLREHGDIDVLVLRRDHLAVQEALRGWEWWAADPPGVLRPWRPQEVLPAGVQDIWCRPAHDKPWQIQVMLDESSGQEWVSRRNLRLRRPIAALGHTSADGIPYLAPEIQLFYKAEDPRPKDEHDFTDALTVLGSRQRDWLRVALADTYRNHPWQRALGEFPDRRRATKTPAGTPGLSEEDGTEHRPRRQSAAGSGGGG
ncbi:nucleotidyltransferase domain-containing protein [Amycolatopsis sp. lyj-109]|uniref:nucleotidyltransferase domain-containing protein n=1 Tax=Amycolatopsis sp. lyj-109 TaxID=2789287 RepID=UPI00397BB8C1